MTSAAQRFMVVIDSWRRSIAWGHYATSAAAIHAAENLRRIGIIARVVPASDGVVAYAGKVRRRT